jgi:hypothetical protein
MRIAAHKMAEPVLGTAVYAKQVVVENAPETFRAGFAEEISAHDTVAAEFRRIMDRVTVEAAWKFFDFPVLDGLLGFQCAGHLPKAARFRRCPRLSDFERLDGANLLAANSCRNEFIWHVHRSSGIDQSTLNRTLAKKLCEEQMHCPSALRKAWCRQITSPSIWQR